MTQGDDAVRRAEHSPADAPDPVADVDAPPEADPTEAASAALSRARRVARDKGLRPGSQPNRRRKAGQLGTYESKQDKNGRDPAALGDQMDRLLRDRDWRVDVAAGAVMGRWTDIVGADVAEHTSPVTFEDGVLTVRAESTAWATQLRLLTSTVMGQMEQVVGPDVVTELRVVGPSAPSWSRGLRKAHGGRGPRDTYG